MIFYHLWAALTLILNMLLIVSIEIQHVEKRRVIRNERSHSHDPTHSNWCLKVVEVLLLLLLIVETCGQNNPRIDNLLESGICYFLMFKCKIKANSTLESRNTTSSLFQKQKKQLLVECNFVEGNVTFCIFYKNILWRVVDLKSMTIVTKLIESLPPG